MWDEKKNPVIRRDQVKTTTDAQKKTDTKENAPSHSNASPSPESKTQIQSTNQTPAHDQVSLNKNKKQPNNKKKRKKRSPEAQAAYEKRKAIYLAKQKKQRQRQKMLRRIYESALLSIGVLVLVFVLFKVRIHRIEGQSMAPTLSDKEIVLTEKTKNIQRGELMIFKMKNTKETYVKRVIGMPGDAIWLEGMTLYINPYIKAGTSINPSNGKQPSGTITIELKTADLRGIQGFSHIPNDSYFVIGDNYDNSVDSRNFGFVSRNLVVGKLF